VSEVVGFDRLKRLLERRLKCVFAAAFYENGDATDDRKPVDRPRTCDGRQKSLRRINEKNKSRPRINDGQAKADGNLREIREEIKSGQEEIRSILDA
jgi:hypothetical protein